jgi:hypothetical protein
MRGFSSSFNRAFFNSKNQFNFLNSKINQNMSKIKFSNKSFYTRIINLSNSSTLASIMNQYRIMSTAIGTGMDPTESETNKLQSDLNGGIGLLSELFLCKDVSKWTCSTRLSTGPISINEHSSII